MSEASPCAAEYDEAKERQIAEWIFEWWTSRQSFATWYEKKFAPRLDLEIKDNEDETIDNKP